MRNLSFSLIFFIFLAFSASAQTKEARKIDEFGVIPCGDFRSRLDNFLAKLQNELRSKGFVIVYEGKYSYQIYDQYPKTKLKTYLPAFGESNYRTQIMMNHFKFRNFPSDKYLFISGGYRENHAVELWIIPNGATPPKPTPTLDKINYRKGKPIKIDCGEV
ncbi:MAG: hypothetical protein M3367_05320 [Acidobacteriota bacterium]|nr:hypothetical protein [Acidobacteriota bacterium]